MKIAVAFLFVVSIYLFFSVRAQEAPKPVAEAEVEVSSNVGIAQDAKGAQEENEKGICECAVFDSQTPTPKDVPLISKNTVKVLCNEEGKKQCEDLCRVLARAAHDNADTTLCLTLGHVENLKASVFAKVCKETVYTYTNITSPETYCCHESKPVICKEAKGGDTVAAP